MRAAGGHADGEVERARVAHGVDGHVDPAPVGGGLDRRARVLLGEVHGRRAEAAGHVEARVDAVDGDDLGRARGARGLDGAQPDRPEAEHRDAVARAHRHGRVEAGAHHVAGEERDVAGHPVRDAAQGEVGVGHERLLGLRARQAAEGGAVTEGPRALALVVVARAARAADGARHLEAAQHAVADRDRADRVAGRDDGADVLVADGEARLDGHAAVVDVQVAAAHAGGLDADDGVVGRLQLGVGALVDAHLARRLEGDRVHQGCTLTTTAPWRGATLADEEDTPS